MKSLDFLIIGAQKCATTALFEHLRQHPQINMPLEKEVPFFTRSHCDESAWNEYAQQHFGTADGRLWGKATPQYMCDPSAAQRIRALMPNTRLVAILRDPIDRTHSHHLMGQRRATEDRTFDDSIDQLLTPDALVRNRELPVPSHQRGYESEANFYVAWSEYGRVLQQYVRQFGRDQLLVLYAEDLHADPAGTLDKLLAFIGLDPGFRPDGLGEVIHKGGGSNRIPHGFRQWLRQRKVLYSLWQRVPAAQQGRLRFLYERWNVRKEAVGVSDTSAIAQERLRQHFSADLAPLKTITDSLPPWFSKYQMK